MTRLIGVPSVCPSNTPDKIRTVSDSFRWETRALCPGARRSRSGWMSASDRGSRGGQPSTTAPVAPPCDSPQVVTRKRRPQVLPMRRGYVPRSSNSKLEPHLHACPPPDRSPGCDEALDADRVVEGVPVERARGRIVGVGHIVDAPPDLEILDGAVANAEVQQRIPAYLGLLVGVVATQIVARHGDHVRADPEVVQDSDLCAELEVLLGDAGDAVAGLHLHAVRIGHAGQGLTGLICRTDEGVAQVVLEPLPRRSLQARLHALAARLR